VFAYRQRERLAFNYYELAWLRNLAPNVGVDELADLSVLKMALVGALPAALSVLKSLSAVYVLPGDKSASLFKVGYETITKVIVEAPAKKVTKKAAPAKKAAPKN